MKAAYYLATGFSLLVLAGVVVIGAVAVEALRVERAYRKWAGEDWWP